MEFQGWSEDGKALLRDYLSEGPLVPSPDLGIFLVPPDPVDDAVTI